MTHQDDDDFKRIHPRPIKPEEEKLPFKSVIDFLEKKTSKSRGGGGGGFKGGSGRGNGGDPPFSWGRNMSNGLLIGVIVGLIVLWGVTSSYYTVDISEEAVVTRFGAYHRTTPSGIHFKIPFGIENVYHVQSKTILQQEFGFRTKEFTRTGTTYDKSQYTAESLMLTGDLNVADVEWILQYRIADPWKYLFHARNVENNIRDVSMSIMRRVVGDRLVGDVLTTGRVEIADQAKILSQEVLDQYDMGIKIEKIILQGANPPEKVKPAFNEVNAAKQEQEQTINLAEREYNKVIPEARGNADRLIADAQGYAIDVVNRAMGNATLFEEVLKAYKTSPEVTRRRLYFETMEEVLSRVDKLTLVDSQLKGVLPVFNQPQGALSTVVPEPKPN